LTLIACDGPLPKEFLPGPVVDKWLVSMYVVVVVVTSVDTEENSWPVGEHNR